MGNNQNKPKDGHWRKIKKTKPNYAHCFLVIINVYLLLSIIMFSYFILNIYCSSGLTFGAIFDLASVLQDATIYASLLDVIIVLMKNPGTVLGLAVMSITLILSLLNHAFYSNLISIISIIMIGMSILFIVIRDTSYEFWDADYSSFFGLHLPELDVIMLIILIPVFILFLVNIIKRR